MYNLTSNTISNETIHQINKEYQIYFLFVILLISIQLICNTIEPIILNIGFLKLPTSAIFYVISFAVSDIITENFGFKLAIRATVLNIISQFIYCGIATLVILIPKKFLTSNENTNFHYIFHFISLELIGSIVSLLTAMIANDYIINRLKFIFLGKGFWWRTIVSTLIGEIIMLNIDYNITFIFNKSILDIQGMIFTSMAYKVIAAIILAYPATILSDYIGQYLQFFKTSNE